MTNESLHDSTQLTASAPKLSTAYQVGDDQSSSAADLAATVGTADPVLAAYLQSTLEDVVAAGVVSEETRTLMLNVGLKMMHGFQPQNELEGLIATQMAAVHALLMTSAARAQSSQNDRLRAIHLGMVDRLARTFTRQLEALQRWRSRGEQHIRVEHVRVETGGQAVVGSVLATGL